LDLSRALSGVGKVRCKMGLILIIVVVVLLLGGMVDLGSEAL
jgi:heme A synthase